MLHSGLALLGGDPGNTILLNGVLQTANLEIGVPGFQPQVPTSTSEFRLKLAARARRRSEGLYRSQTQGCAYSRRAGNNGRSGQWVTTTAGEPGAVARIVSENPEWV